MPNSELAVVVGATGAFGKAIVARLKSTGLDIIAVARSANALEALVEEYSVIPCEADISSDESIEQIKSAISKPVRMVVHAPGLPVAGGVLVADPNVMAEAVNIKVGGMMRLARAVDEQLVAQSRLVAIGGHYGFEPTAYAAVAGVANAALTNVMRQLSLAYGPREVTAHLIAPGPADTERMQQFVNRRAKENNISVEDVLKEIKSDSSIGALTTPEQVAWAISVLLAPEANAMTGSTLMLDSGRRRGL